MRLRLLGTIASVAVLGVAEIASAADMPVKAPAAPVAVPFSWTGFYLGGNAGYAWDNRAVNFSSLTEPTFDGASIASSVGVNSNGFIGGVQAGYNYQVGSFVYGIEADISFANVDGNGSAAPVVAGFDIKRTSVEKDLDWLGTVRGRIGFTPMNRSLIYVTGGFAFGHAKLSDTILDISAPCGPITFCGSGSASKTLTGWTAGGGFEYAFTNNWSAKIEYLHFDLGDISYVHRTNIGFLFGATSEFRGDIVRGGINYKFN